MKMHSEGREKVSKKDNLFFGPHNQITIFCK